MSAMQTAPLRLKHRRASEGLLTKNTSTTTQRFMSDFDDSDPASPHTASSHIIREPLFTNPRTNASDMRPIIDQHKKRVGLPSLQRLNGNGSASTATGSSTAGLGSAGVIGSDVSPELNSLFAGLNQRKKSLQASFGSDASARPLGSTVSGSTSASSLAALGGASTGIQQSARSTNVSSTSSSSINQALSSSSQQQLLNSGSFSKTSSTHHTSHASSSSAKYHVSSSSSSSEMKPKALERDLTNFKSSIMEMDSLASSNKSISNFQKKMRASMENLIDGSDTEQLVTFPDDDCVDESPASGASSQSLIGTGSNGELRLLPSAAAGGLIGSTGSGETVKFAEKRTTTASKCKVITGDGFSTEQASSNSSEMKHLQAGDVDYKEQTEAAAMRKKIEIDGVSAEQNAAEIKEARSFKSADVQQQESNNRAASHVKIQTDTFSAQKTNTKQAQQSQKVTADGIFNQQQTSSSSQSQFSISSKGISTSAAGSMIGSASHLKAINGMLDEWMPAFDELETLRSHDDVEPTIEKFSSIMNANLQSLKATEETQELPTVLNSINSMIQRAWSVPTYGHQLGYGLCNTLRQNGGLDLLVNTCIGNDLDLRFSSARLLEQCLTTENRSHVVENGLEKVVRAACICTKEKDNNTENSRVGTGILEHLFKHSEVTCSDVIQLGGLQTVLFECRKNDVETLRHCAMALANLALYGGAENQESMIFYKVPMWLFPLAFHNDDNIKYYACLAIAVLVANKEIEAEVLKSGTLDLVEPFVTSHNPSEFAKSNLAHAHGQSKHWLARLVPVLSSNREEARNLAAFHFCMEAGIKKEQHKTEIFYEIGAVEPLKIVASCPNAVASKFAAQALRLIGEQVPHKLSQQVPLWSVEDVREWVKQIGFAEYEQNFSESRVDGDLLLQLNDDNLREDIGIVNGIRRKRFRRELENLKKMADYSSKDTARLNAILQNIGAEFSIYTYTMLNAGVDKDSLRNINESQLLNECGITNSIHRSRILNSLTGESSMALAAEANAEKTLDVFVSYRRSNGSQLASLLKVHLQLRGFSVFIDVERLEAGKFDNNLLDSIRQAKNFILVLTPNTLDRCINDTECKDWVHREIVAALTSGCNIIPIIDNFSWPEADVLPDDMRTVCHFNGVRWIHDYQDACVDKLERFLRGEREAVSNRSGGNAAVQPSTPNAYYSNSRTNPIGYQRTQSNDSEKEATTAAMAPSVDPLRPSDSTTITSNGTCPPNARQFHKASSPAPSTVFGSLGRLNRTPVGGGAAAGRATPRAASVAPISELDAATLPSGRRRQALAGGVPNARPPLPPGISSRSQSMDGLLEVAVDALDAPSPAASMTVVSDSGTAPAETTQHHTRNTNQTAGYITAGLRPLAALETDRPKPNPRRLRSTDNLLDGEPATNATADDSKSAGDSERLSVTPERSLTGSDAGVSRQSSVDSAGSNNTNGKGGPHQPTLLNRYVKRVKSFMKK